MKCWASILGGCSNRQSGEHTITEGMLEGRAVHVSGYPWCEGKEKLLPVSGLTQNILCTSHNSDLSSTDEAGIAFQGALWNLKREVARRVFEGVESPPRVERVDGYLLERWMMKTTINAAHSFVTGWIPPAVWVLRAFGRTPFEGTAGMYVLPFDTTNTLTKTYEIEVELLADGTRPVGSVIRIDEAVFAVCGEEFRAPVSWRRRPPEILEGDGVVAYQRIVFGW